MRFILYFLVLIATPVLATQDTDFLAAHDAFRAGDTAKLKLLAQRLNNTPLEVYVSYYQLRLGLDKADVGEIRKFLSRPEDTPVIDLLRGEWLRLLGSKQQWDLFDSEYSRVLNEDTELACYILQSHLRKRGLVALREARALWFSGKGQPESCGVLFEAAISAGIITRQDISQRLRLALESGNVSLAKQLSARLSGDQAVSPKALDSVAANARRYLDQLKLDEPKSVAKAAPAIAKTKKVVAVKARPSAGAATTRPFWQLAPYPLLADPSLYLRDPAGHRQHKSDFYISQEFSLAYWQPAEAKSWRDNFASGCLDFAAAQPDSGLTVLSMRKGKPPVSYVCANPCKLFSISALITMQQSSLNAAQNRLSLSGLQLGSIDTAAVEAMLVKIRPHGNDQAAPPIPFLGENLQLRIASKGLLPDSSERLPGWSRLWERLGLGKTDYPVATATDSRTHTPAGCDPCTTAGTVSTLSTAERSLKFSSEGQRALVLFALQRLAKQSLELAATRWMKIAPNFPESEQQYFYGWLAYEAARNLDGRALQWFKAAGNTPLNEHQSAWRVRAALRAQDWPEVLSSVNAMSEQQQREPAWRYWKARALLALGKSVEARSLFAPLSREYHFYGQLAGEELANTQMLSQAVSAYKPDSQAIAEMLALPGIQRTLALYRMNLHSEALEEWRWVLRNLNDRELLTAAEIAKRNEMYDRAIGAAEKTVNMHDFSLRYLAPYRSELQEHIREHGLDEAWVYGLMRQESRFATGAKSGTGASGLMQVMPSTARWVAKQMKLKSYRNALISRLDTNLRIGTYYMKSVLSHSENSPVLASASYNAGPSRAKQWRSDQPLEGAIYIETIPFEETRDYVKKVMSNTVYYADQFGNPPRSLKQRLGIIAAKPADN